MAKLLRKLNKYEVMLDDEDIKLVTDIRNLTGHFIEALDFLQGQKYPTLNRVAQFIVTIKDRYFVQYLLFFS